MNKFDWRRTKDGIPIIAKGGYRILMKDGRTFMGIHPSDYGCIRELLNESPQADDMCGYCDFMNEKLNEYIDKVKILDAILAKHAHQKIADLLKQIEFKDEMGVMQNQDYDELCLRTEKAEKQLRDIKILFTYDTNWNGLAVGIGPDVMGFETRLKSILSRSK